MNIRLPRESDQNKSDLFSEKIPLNSAPCILIGITLTLLIVNIIKRSNVLY